MGLAAGYYLAEKGVKTLMIDAYNPPHAFGSHGGDTRLIRHAVGEGLEYIPLALRAQKLWNELQAHTNDEIFRKIGILNFGYAESDFLQKTIDGARAFNLKVETLSSEEIKERWPGVHGDDVDIGYYEEDGGVIFGENALRAFRRLALEKGAELLVDTPVQNIQPGDETVTIETENDSFTADKLILSAGGWNGEFLKDLGIEVNIQPSRRTIAWFDADEEYYGSEHMPGFIGRSYQGNYYGFSSIDGTGVKIGRYDGEPSDDKAPEEMNQKFGDLEKDEGDLRSYLANHMSGANGALNRGVACIFTNTPDMNFIIDQHPDYDNIYIAGGFSGHGFKFIPVVGEILTDLITKGYTEQDISPFSITRPELYE